MTAVSHEDCRDIGCPTCRPWERASRFRDRMRELSKLGINLRCLAHNLAVAGAMERAFNLGWNRGYEEGNMYGEGEHDIPYIPSEHEKRYKREWIANIAGKAAP